MLEIFVMRIFAVLCALAQVVLGAVLYDTTNLHRFSASTAAETLGSNNDSCVVFGTRFTPTVDGQTRYLRLQLGGLAGQEPALWDVGLYEDGTTAERIGISSTLLTVGNSLTGASFDGTGDLTIDTGAVGTYLVADQSYWLTLSLRPGQGQAVRQIDWMADLLAEGEFYYGEWNTPCNSTTTVRRAIWRGRAGQLSFSICDDTAVRGSECAVMPTPSVSASASVTASASISATVSPSLTASSSVTISATPSASQTASATPSASLTPSVTASNSLTSSVSATPSETPSESASASQTASGSASATPKAAIGYLEGNILKNDEQVQNNKCVAEQRTVAIYALWRGLIA